MKRCWIGLGLLLVLLAGGLLVTWYMGSCHREIGAELEQAARYAQLGNWAEAADAAGDAYEDWQEEWRFSAAFADHEPMEEIDAMFAQLGTYLAARDAVSFSAVCRQLSSQLEAMGDAHGLTWWNLL